MNAQWIRLQGWLVTWSTACVTPMEGKNQIIRERKVNKFIKILAKTCKFDPEGTRGPIWPEMVPLF